jgi:hypothetical protein
VARRKPIKKTRRDKMVDNNTLAREWMIRNGYTDIWLKKHTKFLDSVWSHNASPDGMQVTKYMAQDIWNLFDGLAIHPEKIVTFLAIGIQFKKIKELEQFLADKKGMHVLMIKINRKAMGIKSTVVTVKEWKV